MVCCAPPVAAVCTLVCVCTLAGLTPVGVVAAWVCVAACCTLAVILPEIVSLMPPPPPPRAVGMVRAPALGPGGPSSCAKSCANCPGGTGNGAEGAAPG